MWEYSQVLHNIRMQPECAQRFTVEECEGYADAAPYTTFLKAMENDFRCSGFCYRQPDAAFMATGPGNVSEASAPEADAPENIPLLQHATARKHRRDKVTPLALLATVADRVGGVSMAVVDNKASQPSVASRYPPTLFSDANYQASCEGMAARDMKNFAGDVSYQTFYQGIYLVVVAVAMGFLKLLGFCVRRDRGDKFGPKALIL